MLWTMSQGPPIQDSPSDAILDREAHVRYVFLDTVGFTRNRYVEVQARLVDALNAIVTESVESNIGDDRDVILIPTGDGIAIAILNSRSWDIHLRLALTILARLADYNGQQQEPMDKFDLRIGLNENVDNVIRDINGQRNVAGSGISMAQRIMDHADAGQIMVGRAVYEILSPREKYAKHFRPFQAHSKHGLSFPIYQYVGQSPGLNTDTPVAFRTTKPEESKLTRFAAYYIAHALKHRQFLLSRNADFKRDYAATVLLGLLAEDSKDVAIAATHEAPLLITWKAGSVSFEEQYQHYYQNEWKILSYASKFVSEHYLSPYRSLFEGGEYDPSFVFPSKAGFEKLLKDWPSIAKEFFSTNTAPAG
jgi:class 3 adenylate cyclase